MILLPVKANYSTATATVKLKKSTYVESVTKQKYFCKSATN